MSFEYSVTSLFSVTKCPLIDGSKVFNCCSYFLKNNELLTKYSINYLLIPFLFIFDYIYGVLIKYYVFCTILTITIYFVYKNKLLSLPMYPELEEEKIGLYTPVMYDKFNLCAHKTINNLTNLIKEYKENNYNIIGYGAAAKGQTLICYGNIELDYIIDENELKIGTYSPKLDIPIVSLNHFEQDTSKNILIIVLAWNFADEIIRKIQNSKNFENKNIKFVKKYFPNIVCL